MDNLIRLFEAAGDSHFLVLFYFYFSLKDTFVFFLWYNKLSNNIKYIKFCFWEDVLCNIKFYCAPTVFIMVDLTREVFIWNYTQKKKIFFWASPYKQENWKKGNIIIIVYTRVYSNRTKIWAFKKFKYLMQN